MMCATCGSEMVELIFTTVCDKCDRPTAPAPGAYRGYIVFRSRPPGSSEYVFRETVDAEIWRAAAALQQFPIRAVVSARPIEWRQSSGSVAGIWLGVGTYEIYPTTDYEPGPRRVHLEPVER